MHYVSIKNNVLTITEVKFDTIPAESSRTNDATHVWIVTPASFLKSGELSRRVKRNQLGESKQQIKGIADRLIAAQEKKLREARMAVTAFLAKA